MVQYSEKRVDLRTTHKVPVMLEDLEDGFIYRARMVNYSKSGMYLETDVVLDLGAEIYVGIEDSPYTISSSTFSSKASQYFRAKIRWQREIKDDLFNFGYGVNILFVVRSIVAGEFDLCKTQKITKPIRDWSVLGV